MFQRYLWSYFCSASERKKINLSHEERKLIFFWNRKFSTFINFWEHLSSSKVSRKWRHIFRSNIFRPYDILTSWSKERLISIEAAYKSGKEKLDGNVSFNRKSIDKIQQWIEHYAPRADDIGAKVFLAERPEVKVSWTNLSMFTNKFE